MDASRVLADLDELERRTGGPDGARRVCWTAGWQAARDLLAERLAELPVEVERDEAGNLWAWLRGQSDEYVAVGSHIDSVPAGGRLDGALGVMAALEVLRAAAELRAGPARGVALVDFADEEGARFGRSLLGSSAFAGTLDPAAVRGLRDADGVTLEQAVAEFGLDVERMGEAASRRGALSAYLELHIEQGPVLEAEGVACAAVEGCAGVERHRVVFEGKAGHAGTTPMDRRRDAGVAAARLAAGLPAVADAHGGVCTAGRIELSPGIVTAVAGRAEVLVDQRHLDPGALAAMLSNATALWHRAAEEEGCAVEAERIWAIEPVPFHAGLVAAARDACATGRTMPSGALHDAAEVARVIPTAMVFSSSTDGVSHAPGETTPEPDLRTSIEAFGALALGVVAEGVPPR